MQAQNVLLYLLSAGIVIIIIVGIAIGISLVSFLRSAKKLIEGVQILTQSIVHLGEDVKPGLVFPYIASVAIFTLQKMIKKFR